MADPTTPSIEDTLELSPRFDANGLLPAVAVDAATGEVLMLAYMNCEALHETLRRKEAVYYSRSRQELWHKGATSGHVQRVRDVRIDCDQDAVVLLVDQLGGGACHTGYRSCFFRRVVGRGEEAKLERCEDAPAFDPAAVYGKKGNA